MAPHKSQRRSSTPDPEPEPKQQLQLSPKGSDPQRLPDTGNLEAQHPIIILPAPSGMESYDTGDGAVSSIPLSPSAGPPAPPSSLISSLHQSDLESQGSQEASQQHIRQESEKFASQREGMFSRGGDDRNAGGSWRQDNDIQVDRRESAILTSVDGWETEQDGD